MSTAGVSADELVDACKAHLSAAVIQLADDHLILGHRLSEWCGHAPMLEEDLSMPNMALDLLGQCRYLYSFAAEIEGQGRTEDDIAYLRSDREYRNCLLVEYPNVDFAYTMLRQFYFAAYMHSYWNAFTLLDNQSDLVKPLVAIAERAVKEVGYHVRHSGEWIIRLGDGTDESADKMRDAVEELHPYTSELFYRTPELSFCIERGLLPDPSPLESNWVETLDSVFQQAKLAIPECPYPQLGGREGRHSESFGFLLSDLQYMQRAYPGASW